MRRRINNFLARAVSKFRIALLGLLIAAPVFLVGYLVYSEVKKKLVSRLHRSRRRGPGSLRLVAGRGGRHEEGRPGKGPLGQAGPAHQPLPAPVRRGAGTVRARRGGLREKGVGRGAEGLQTLAARFPKSYLAPVSLFDAAICSEEKGDKDGAQKLYVQAYTSYKDSTVAPRALFDAARLDEARATWADAQKKYESDGQPLPQSFWTRLAKNRLVELKVQGKIK